MDNIEQRKKIANILKRAKIQQNQINVLYAEKRRQVFAIPI